ncbi:MAG: Nramp family divalent metal transporter [Thermaerobacter sp.]
MGPPMEVSELPAPPPFTFSNFLKMIGVSAILLSVSIGSGEWLLGPAAVIQYGPQLLWIVTVACVLQTVFNLESQRYTLYTGEPVMVGLMRLAPGRWLWGPIWILLTVVSIGPGWALSSATALAAMALGRMPGQEDKAWVVGLGIAAMVLVMLVVSFGQRVERTLARVSTVAIAFIFLSLLVFNIWLVPGEWWGKIAAGFFNFGYLPSAQGGTVDWILLGGFAAYAASGGIFNMATSNWMRDRGWGMGSQVGYIPTLVGGHRIEVAETGKVFRITEDNLRRFRAWMRYAGWEQWTLYFVGCLVGMYMSVLLAAGLIPQGTQVDGWAVAARQAEAVAQYLGGFGWYWVLFIGFWVLWGTQLNATDAAVRHLTDLLWSLGPSFRRLAQNDIRRIYYLILAVVTLWLAYLFVVGTPLGLVLLVSNAAGLVFVVGGLMVLWLNSTLLPKELQPGLLTRILMLALVVFYGFFVWKAIQAALGG